LCEVPLQAYYLSMFIWNAYVHFVREYPLLSSAIQVAILGTFGELLGSGIRGKGWWPFTPVQLLLKVIVWAFLGITFKYAFAGFFGFFAALVEHGFWPSLGGNALWRAFSVSVFTNILFGPVMMAFHRWTDNLIERKAMN